MLHTLAELGNPTLVYAPNISSELKGSFIRKTLSFAAEPLDIREVGRSCDYAITNGNPWTTMELLLHGVPSLQIPTTFEQYLFARKLADNRLGICYRAEELGGFDEVVVSFVFNELLAKHALEFSSRYNHLLVSEQSHHVGVAMLNLIQ